MTETDLDQRCHSLTRLDRRISRAVSTDRGIKLSQDELSILAELGLCQLLSDAKAAALLRAIEERRKAKSFTGGIFR